MCKVVMNMLGFIRRGFGLKRRKPALFLHIQKTAGTSIVTAAQAHYGRSNVVSHGDFVGRSPEEFMDVPFVSGHFGYNFARPLLNGRFSFTFLRSPVERVVSLYYFCKSRDPDQFPIYKLAHEYDLEEFVMQAKCKGVIRHHVWNAQVWNLAGGPGPVVQRPGRSMEPDALLQRAIEHMRTLSFVGFTEAFDEDGAAVSRALGMSSGRSLGRDNVTPRRESVEDLAESVISAINDVTDLDRKLYEVAWRDRVERLANVSEARSD